MFAETCSGTLFCLLFLSAATTRTPTMTPSRAVSSRVRRNVRPTARPILLSLSLSQWTTASSVSACKRKNTTLTRVLYYLRFSYSPARATDEIPSITRAKTNARRGSIAVDSCCSSWMMTMRASAGGFIACRRLTDVVNKRVRDQASFVHPVRLERPQDRSHPYNHTSLLPTIYS